MRSLTDTLEGIRIALRALLRNKLRAALTTLGIVIGVATVILMIIIIMGLNHAVEKQFTFLGSNTIYVSRWEWMFGEADWRAMLKRRHMKVEYANLIERESALAEAVSPLTQASRSVKFHGATLTRVDIFGVNENYLVTNSIRIEEGRFFNEQDVQRNRMVCVLGHGIADQLFDKIPPVGQRLDIGGTKFQIIGVNEKMGRFFGQDMDNFVWIPIGVHQKLYGRHDRDMDIVVKAARAEDVDELQWELRGIMRRARGLKPYQPNDFGINAQSMIMNQFRAITAGIYGGGLLIAFISLIVGGIGIMNIMLVSVTERTSEIGLRKALGAKRWMIAWQFLIESAVICALGGVLGVALAFAGSFAMDKFIPTTLPVTVALFGVAFAAMVGVFFGLYPSIKAARLSPIEALRHE